MRIFLLTLIVVVFGYSSSAIAARPTDLRGVVEQHRSVNTTTVSRTRRHFSQVRSDAEKLAAEEAEICAAKEAEIRAAEEAEKCSPEGQRRLRAEAAERRRLAASIHSCDPSAVGALAHQVAGILISSHK